MFAKLRLISELFLKVTSEFSIMSTELTSLPGIAVCFTWVFCNPIAVVEAYVDAVFSIALSTELVLGTTPCATLFIEGMIVVSSLDTFKMLSEAMQVAGVDCSALEFVAEC